MVLESTKDPPEQAHNEGLMIIDANVDKIIEEWMSEWRNPLAELLPKEQNQEYPPNGQ